jgi:SAM-dependent methyltransferase
MTGAPSIAVWHDLECGGYAEDLPLWHELARAAGGPILDVGAGTGRVTLELARAGHELVALDVDERLLAVLAERAAGLRVQTVAADARGFSLGRRFGLILASMQTVQLLGGEVDALLDRVAAHLAPGGLFAAAIADPEAYEGEARPLPDVREQDGWLWSSQPVAVRRAPTGMLIVRRRETVSPDGEHTVEPDEILLTTAHAEDLEAAGARHGLRPLPRREIPPTADYVGSEVVVLGG